MALLTLFSLPKPFNDPKTIIMQKNALNSWLQLMPDVDIILLGDDEGVKEVAQEYGCLHLGGGG